MKYLFPLLFLVWLAGCLLSCGEDRSGEQPFPPTVESFGVTIVGDSALLHGVVTSSPNSSLRECGFSYGNDTLQASTLATEPSEDFIAVSDSLGAGVYYAVAFARNGMGTSYGDTIYFTKP